jgi:DNA-binding response OmpR family regulator
MGQKRVLIVDDDETTRLSLATLLRSNHVVVRGASTMKEAETMMDVETFDLVITDLHLTGRADLQGLELISAVKAKTPRTVVVLLTGYGSSEIEHEARRRGADDYWEKTIMIPELVERARALGISAGQ